MDLNEAQGCVALVRYEVRECVHLVAWIDSEGLEVEAEQTVRNAMLEAFLVHVRCLAEFLLNKDSRGQSYVARDLFPDWTAQDQDSLHDAWGAISKHLSHLDRGRTLMAGPPWDVAGLVAMLLVELGELAGAVDQTYPDLGLGEVVAWARSQAALGSSPPPSATTSDSSISIHSIQGSTRPPSSH